MKNINEEMTEDEWTRACLESTREMIAPYGGVEPWATMIIKIDEELLRLSTEVDDHATPE